MWSIRFVLRKVIGKHVLRLLKQRFRIVVPEEGHYLCSGVAERDIVFRIEVRNPTRHRLIIRRGALELLYQGIIVSTQEIDSIEIPPETRVRPVEARYNPFLHAIGLPVQPGEWRIKGNVTIHTAYGEFDREFESERPLKVTHNGGWDEARSYVREKLLAMRGGE